MKNFWKSGDPFVWLTGGAIALSLIMILGLLGLIVVNGLRQFWPPQIVELHLQNGETVLGEIWEREEILALDGQGSGHRIRLKIGNRDLYPLDFRWIDESEIVAKRYPENVLVLERLEWGNFYGRFNTLKQGNTILANSLGTGQEALADALAEMALLRTRIRELEKDEIGSINYDLEKLRLEARKLLLTSDTTSVAVQRSLTEKRKKMTVLQRQYLEKEKALSALYTKSREMVLTATSADGREKAIKIFDIVRLTTPNALDVVARSRVFLSRVAEFVSAEPRESNTEGGVFPAIFGTVILVLIMSVAVAPLGVLAAVYLHEYAKQGLVVSAIRIAVNNLAGVPSIVYGVFGLGFFVYAIGGTLDQLFYAEALPTPTLGTGGILWASLTLALLTVPVVIVATEEGLAAVPREIREGSLALAATQFETLWRVVIPSALPGILTGLILAIARAAGEVAPLMITGVVKLAPSMPFDGRFPFLHLERKFMHLGVHIYDVGFQSPNVEAAIPMVYSTTLLLILIVILLNVVAISVRNRLRKKLAYSVF